MIKDLKESHPFIYHIALKRYKDCRGGNGDNSDLYHFVWYDTPEGHDIWRLVKGGNYQLFYGFHGRNITTGNLD